MNHAETSPSGSPISIGFAENLIMSPGKFSPRDADSGEAKTQSPLSGTQLGALRLEIFLLKANLALVDLQALVR